jgi:hypothetical protein
VALPTTSRLDGLSLAPLLRGRTTDWPDRKLVINYSRMPQATDRAGPDSQSIPRQEGAAVLWRRWRWLEDRSLYDLATDPLQERDVAAQHPEVVAELRAHLAAWWDGVRTRVNEPGRVSIGHAAESPTLLSACEWWDVFVDQQAQVRRGVPRNGVWHLTVTQSGEYEIELRRWPREAALPIAGGAPAGPHAFGTWPAGEALPIAAARLVVGGQERSAPVGAQEVAARFVVPLKAGPAELQTWFLDSKGAAVVGAYYAYVTKL